MTVLPIILVHNIMAVSSCYDLLKVEVCFFGAVPPPHAFYCFLGFHYFCLFQGVLCVFQQVQFANPNTQHLELRVQVDYRPIIPYTVPIDHLAFPATYYETIHYFQSYLPASPCGWLLDSLAVLPV